MTTRRHIQMGILPPTIEKEIHTSNLLYLNRLLSLKKNDHTMAPTTRRMLLEKREQDQANHWRTQGAIPEDNSDDSALTAPNGDLTNDDIPPEQSTQPCAYRNQNLLLHLAPQTMLGLQDSSTEWQRACTK